MDLNEIEAKADELAAVLMDEYAGRQHHEHAALRLRALAHAVQIKATVAYRQEREAERVENNALRAREIAAMEAAAGATAEIVARSQQTQDQVPPRPGDLLKPAVDRLHELVSYLVSHSVEEHHKAGEEIEGWKAAKHGFASKAYDDAATKLQEILSEGGI